MPSQPTTSRSEGLYPQFPLYVVSKSRSEYMVTSKALTKMGVAHFIVVEPEQVPAYEEAVVKLGLCATILPLDMRYKETYELCDEHGLTRSTGPGPARNFAWDHSVACGFAWHWVMDDNIIDFYRLNLNTKLRVYAPSFWRAMEDFCLRYENIAMAGPNYFMFAPRKNKVPPFVMNTRIYSCNLIRNDVPFRWRGRYNEDTIISLDMLKAGWCTIQFNAFLQQKMPTQTINGGNTAEFYAKEGKQKKGEKYADNGTLNKSKMQVAVHPDVSRLVWKFGRWHHHVDYHPFKRNRLVLKKGLVLPKEADEYGMALLNQRPPQ